jgi:hypothetical protein
MVFIVLPSDKVFNKTLFFVKEVFNFFDYLLQHAIVITTSATNPTMPIPTIASKMRSALTIVIFVLLSLGN